MHRSKTAEELFRNRFETMSAGLFNDDPVSREQISWADLIVVMEDFQKKEIANRFPKEYLQRRIVSLEIPDVYYYNQAELIEVLNLKINSLVEPLIE